MSLTNMKLTKAYELIGVENGVEMSYITFKRLIQAHKNKIEGIILKKIIKRNMWIVTDYNLFAKSFLKVYKEVKS